VAIQNEWEIKTFAVKPRSAELKLLDTAVKDWASRGPGVAGANLKSSWAAFQTWKGAQAGEYNRIKGAADGLQQALAEVWDPKAQVAGGGASSVQPLGWVLVNYNPATHGGSLLPVDQQVPPLTATEISRVNEAMRRVKVAIAGARDAMVKIQGGQGTVEERKAHADFFGAADATRLQKLVLNFRALVLAFEGKPQFIDCRNRTVWANTYGGCVRRDLRVIEANTKALSLSGSVEMLMGRSFLGASGRGYAATTDDTIATLVHEFAHGALNAVDVPDVDATGAFGCARQSDDPANADFGNSTDPFNHQCSQEADDIVLATHRPDYALVNADNYGQFTKRLLMEAKG
jgi:hypothetical protein